MADSIDKVLETHARVIDDGHIGTYPGRYKRLAVSTLRGGVGKSSISFNLAYEISRKRSLLIGDVCPQCNLTETIFKDERPAETIYAAIQPKVLGPAFGEEITEFSYRVSSYVPCFNGGKGAFMLAGDAEMFSFPSSLYQQLQIAMSRGGATAVRNLLLSLKGIFEKEASIRNCDTIICDTSPFYAGGTHLAWCASEAIIIPVRVDEHSIESLALTLEMLSNPGKDFVVWNERAGGLPSPKVAAIVMTMVGSKSQKKSTPDAASRMYIEKALGLAEKHHDLFDFPEPSDAFVLTNDFMSAGRISGAQSTPIALLKSGQFHRVGGKRIQVNSSVERYKSQIRYLASIL